MLKIIVDAMGGDHAPVEIVKGAVESLTDRSDFKVILTGDEALIKHELDKYTYDASRVEIVGCTQVITNDDVPTHAVRSKRDSSLVVGLNILKNDISAGGFVSAGSTGAVLTGGIMFIGRIKGVMRPALCPGIPNVRGSMTLLCDCGANAECKPQYLAQFGLMASAYARAAYGVENPRVGLLTNGTEEHKGDPLHQEAHQLLKNMQGINFVGNIEGRDIMYGDVDVAVADGFSGNIALKAIEGCGKTVAEMLKKEFTASLPRKLSYLVAKKPISGLSNALDYSRFGGSVFLGLKKVVVKSHGSSKAKSIKPSIYQAIDACKGGLIGMMEDMLTKTSGQVKTPDLAAAEAAIGYTFSDKALLARCFCHSSAANLGGGESNERLEFLGDAVVQLYVTDLLYRTDGGREGALTAKRQSYVSRGALEAACEALGLVDYLRYTGDVLVHGKTAANLYEAVVGGIYLDGGYAAAEAFLARTLLPQEAGNFRALLQEFVQARSKALPVYSSQETEGGVVCTVSALGESAEACAPTKKLAERAAARCLFGKLSEQ